MTYLAQPRQFTLPEFQAYVKTLTWSKGWKPSFLTGHNTAAPRLSQYLAYSPATRKAWPNNLNRYYKGLGWHSGPHLVIAPNVEGGGIWLLCDLEQDGVSVSCWNAKTIGIENVGDYETEDPTTGHGAEVRDTFVGVAAALCSRLGWTPRPHVLGVKGIHWHHECTKDNHPCPGRNWDGDDVIRRVEAAMGAASPIPNAKPVPVTPPAPTLSVSDVQRILNAAGYRPTLVVDGVLGPKTKDALARFQQSRGIHVDGALSVLTLNALSSFSASKA